MLRRIFVGPNGIRAGWRLAIFAAAAALATFAVDKLKVALIHALPRGSGTPLDPVRLTIREFGDFSTLIAAGFLMAFIEKRRIGEYGLSLRRAFRVTFWEGALYGFGGVTLLLGLMYLSGSYQFGVINFDSIRWAAIYLLAFLGVALMEEYSFRGYILYTLGTGIGFWPAALLMAAVFGYAHGDNSGETALGIVNLVLFYLVFCFVLRRTGDLWMAVGFHLAWNWGEAFFYGLPDSGIYADAHLLTPIIHGPALLTGGSAGPEASLLDPLILLLVALAVHLRYPAR